MAVPAGKLEEGVGGQEPERVLRDVLGNVGALAHRANLVQDLLLPLEEVGVVVLPLGEADKRAVEHLPENFELVPDRVALRGGLERHVSALHPRPKLFQGDGKERLCLQGQSVPLHQRVQVPDALLGAGVQVVLLPFQVLLQADHHGIRKDNLQVSRRQQGAHSLQQLHGQELPLRGRLEESFVHNGRPEGLEVVARVVSLRDLGLCVLPLPRFLERGNQQPEKVVPNRVQAGVGGGRPQQRWPD
mmetsp:Transcript_4212/g.15058  ORF Transcript_4212/g.15058 Transcript_4212/m.15058 type:complete len:245 (-) Transcript_4212:841-1575(-)